MDARRADVQRPRQGASVEQLSVHHGVPLSISACPDCRTYRVCGLTAAGIGSRCSQLAVSFALLQGLQDGSFWGRSFGRSFGRLFCLLVGLALELDWAQVEHRSGTAESKATGTGFSLCVLFNEWKTKSIPRRAIVPACWAQLPLRFGLVPHSPPLVVALVLWPATLAAGLAGQGLARGRQKAPGRGTTVSICIQRCLPFAGGPVAESGPPARPQICNKNGGARKVDNCASNVYDVCVRICCPALSQNDKKPVHFKQSQQSQAGRRIPPPLVMP